MTAKTETIVRKVLNVIIANKPISTSRIIEKLPNVSSDMIRKIVHRLFNESRIVRVGEYVDEGRGPMQFLYANFHEGMQYGPQEGGEVLKVRKLIQVRHKERKIAYLQELISNASDIHKDLLMGMLADYEGKT